MRPGAADSGSRGASPADTRASSPAALVSVAAPARRRSLAARVEAAGASLRNAAVTRPDPLALLEGAVARIGEAVRADRAAAFVSVGDGPLVRCASWPPDVGADGAELDASAAGLLPSAALGAAWPHALALPVRGAADGALVVSRAEPWTDAEASAAADLAALFSTLWAWSDAEARFQRTVADLDDALFTVAHDADGRRAYPFVTPQIEALTGLDPDAVLAGDADWADLVHADDRAAFAAHDARLRDGHASRVDVRLALPDGETVWIAERATPGLDAAGRPTASGVVQDVTAQKEAEATLDAARRVAERAASTRMAFLRLMSHELRTPLGAVRGFAELLAEEVAALDGAPPEAGEFAATIRDAADRALTLVSSLLDLAQLETGAIELSAQPVDLAGVARAVAARHAPAASVPVTVCAPPEAVVTGDPARLEAVVDALVENAVAFTSEGAVALTVEADGESVRLAVRDTGVGMATDYVERLFEPFAQEDTRVARGHEGTGLSLAIAHRLVAAMGGTLAAESAPGVGSTFVLTLTGVSSLRSRQ